MLIKGADGRAIEGVEGKLRTLASVITREHEQALLGEAFLASNADVAVSLTGTAAREVLMLLTNEESEYDLVVERVKVASAAAGMGFLLHRNPTLVALGANTPGIAHNLNFSDEGAPSVAIEIWDETAGGITGVTVTEDFDSFLVGAGFHEFKYDGALVIPPGRTLGIDKTAVAGEVTCSIRFHRTPIGLLTPQ